MFGLKSIVATLAFATLAVGIGSAQVTLRDGNSRADIDPNSSTGMYNFKVGGVDHLFQQWFWYRHDGMGDEASIDTISTATVTQLALNQASLRYDNGIIRVEVFYLLTGGTPGSGQGDIAESIRITNVSNTVMNLAFFQYTDFDLNDSPGGDVVVNANANTMQQSEGLVAASETVATPAANHWEVGGFPSIITKFFDGLATTLSDSGSPFGPGDGTFAWQWNRTLNPNGSFLISKDKRIEAVPEPASMIALGTGLVGLVLRRRRK